MVFYAQSTSKVISGRESEREEGRGRDRQVFVMTPVSIPVCMDPFQRQREGWRERGRHQVFMVTPVSNREREGWRERGRHEVFMVTPVSNTERKGWRERGRHQVFMVTPMSIPLCMDRF